MPRWLRQFTFNKINEYYQKENEEYEKASSKGSGNKSTLIDSSGKVNREAWKSVPKPITPASRSAVKYK